MNAEALETAIVALIGGMDIPAQAYPKDIKSYVPAAWPGEMLVRYVGTQYTPGDVAGVRKNRTQVIEIIGVSKELRGEQGLYTWMDRIREQLEGFVMLGAGGPLEMDTEEFADEYNGTWQFGQHWLIKSNYEYGQIDDYTDRPLGD